MISSSEEGPPTRNFVTKSHPWKWIVVRQSSVTETTQLVPSYETCVELRRTRFDETSNLTGASRKLRIVEC